VIRLLLLLLLLPGVAAAGEVGVVTARSGLGLRHSTAAEGAGIDLRVGGDVYVKYIGLGMTFEWTNDRSFGAKADERRFGRSTTCINLAGRIPFNESLSLELGFGGAIGWIRQPELVERYPSHGINEYVRFAIVPGGMGIYIAIEGAGQHLWQPTAPAPTIDHGILLLLNTGLQF
jgi:hypothetical protein